MRSDDLAQLFTQDVGGVAQPIGYRQGLIIAWDPVTLQNTVRVGGEELHNLPIRGIADAQFYAVGMIVGIEVFGRTMAISTPYVTPGTQQATDILLRLASRIKTATTTGFQTTNSATFADIPGGTVGPIVENVLIGPSGRCLVLLTAHVQEGSIDIIRGGVMAYDIEGATTSTVTGSSPATHINSLRIGHTDDGDVDGGTSSNNLNMQSTAVHERSGLNPGLHTFTAKYLVAGGGADQVTFGNRTITVFSL